MKNYFKQIYQDAKQMATATKITLLAICLLPGSVLGTLVVYLASVARDTVAKFEVFRALKSFAGESHVDEVHHLAELLFRHSPELWYLVMAVIGTAFISAAVSWLLILPNFHAMFAKAKAGRVDRN
ncbi:MULTISPECIES: hypothetical protein [Pseudomonas]|jgi:hypothetical protein|uniref:Uncharacterized protein n=1 Tax=Pseudomonas asiatica TaxID=2219225 RepID=A0A9X4I3L1_9PSED|nr:MULTISPECIES: hypothetical protein [Pseudomonas]MCG3646651.1 hypothetical protein [Pseudomonas putida]MDD2116019.1 hypothetical protein [Pseudomonas asiatica]TFW18218.1 hypothetical protein E4L40_25975 [Pseudomonas putida]